MQVTGTTGAIRYQIPQETGLKGFNLLLVLDSIQTEMKVLLIVIFFVLTNHGIENDFKRLINSANGNVYYFTKPFELAESVRKLPVKECPETVLFVFSHAGKQLSATAYSKNGLMKYLTDNPPVLRHNSILCVFMNGTILVLKNH